MRPSTARALCDSRVLWLSSVSADGRPHIVPAWFLWDAGRIVLFSKPNARKVRNLRRHPRAMVALGVPGPDFDVELIEADAETPPTTAAETMPPAFAAKYRRLLRRAGLSASRFGEVYSQPIVLRPTRFLGYGGPGWVRMPS
jgi:PPOX class probable F420-dependent enzyme